MAYDRTPPDDSDAWLPLLDAPDLTPGPPPQAPPNPREPVGRYERPAPAPTSVLELGAPPEDAMGAAKWAYQVQMRMANDVIQDSALSPARRRAELQKIFAAAAKWMTDALRYDVAKTIEDDKRQLDAKKRGRAAAKPVKVDKAPPMAKIIPITRDA